MNKMANDYDLKFTNFTNSHGLPNFYNKSTCKDVAKMTYVAMQDEDFRKIVNTKCYHSEVRVIKRNVVKG